MKPSLPWTLPAARVVSGLGFCPFGARNGLVTGLPGCCPGRMKRFAVGASGRNHPSADFQSAVSRVSQPAPLSPRPGLPIGNRRSSRLETCATVRRLQPRGGSVRTRPCAFGAVFGVFAWGRPGVRLPASHGPRF